MGRWWREIYFPVFMDSLFKIKEKFYKETRKAGGIYSKRMTYWWHRMGRWKKTGDISTSLDTGMGIRGDGGRIQIISIQFDSIESK